MNEKISQSEIYVLSNSTIQDIFNIRIFEEPLVPVGADPTPAENDVLVSAILDYSKRADTEDFSSLTGFLEIYPTSSWNVALLTNLGLEYYNTGRYSKALESWSQACDLGRTVTNPRGKALVDRAIGELACMYARLGRVTELETLLKSVQKRAFCGPATEKIAAAREGLWNMKKRPEISFRCGPMALYSIKRAIQPDDPVIKLIDSAMSTPQGLSLRQVAELSCQVGLNFQMAFRDKGTSFVIPSVIHFNEDHFAAIIRLEENHYLLQDPTFRNDVWVTKEVLENEASGYFLIPSGKLPEGWRIVESKEGEAIWGKGFVSPGGDPPGPCDYTTDPCQSCGVGGGDGGDGPDGGFGGGGDDGGPDGGGFNGLMPGQGLADARVHLLNVSLNIIDTPVGYAPPVGPAVFFTVRYNQHDNQFLSTPNYSNLGSKWTFDWLAFIIENGSNSPNPYVTYYMMGGGNRTFTFDVATNTYDPQRLDQTNLRMFSNPFRYEMISPNGSKKIFSKPDGGQPGNGRKIFLTQLVDPYGNAVTLNYDANFRVTSIIDALQQETTLAYELDPSASTPADPSNIYKITKVTDPFNRIAQLVYDTTVQPARLHSITDVMNYTSTFGYEGDSDFVNSMTTPYGITTFTNDETDPTLSSPFWWRSLEIIYPDGSGEYIEFNQNPQLSDGSVPLAPQWSPFTNYPNVSIPRSDPPESVPSGMATTNDFLYYRNTFHWDRQGYAQAKLVNPGDGTGRSYAFDYTQATIYHWLHDGNPIPPNIVHAAGILESIKKPLEGRVWYDYVEQAYGPIAIGNTSKPTHVGRVLDDGSTQLYTYEYNEFGKVTRITDPVGREFSSIYSSDGIDLLEMRQTRAGQNEVLFQINYNAQHQPETIKDSAGQMTTYTYYPINTAAGQYGQLWTVRNAKGETTTYNYTNGYLTSIVGPLIFPNPPVIEGTGQITYVYDIVGGKTYNRIRTKTDIVDYTLTYDYDDLDRVTKITYPSTYYTPTTFTQFYYDDPSRPLDMTKMTDRKDRTTLFEYNSIRQLTKRTDPLDRVTYFGWCKCGALSSLTDPMGRTTTWRYDIQGRPKWKKYADDSKITYIYESTTSRLLQKMDENLQVTQYAYNLDDTLRSKSYTNAQVPTPSVAFNYDTNYLRIISMTDGTGTTYYEYIPITSNPTLGAGQLASIDGPLSNDTLVYGYDELGRRVSTSINEVPYISNTIFDAVGRITNVTNQLGEFVYTYQDINRTIIETYPNGQESVWVYWPIHYIYDERQICEILHRHSPDPASPLISGFQLFDQRHFSPPSGQITTLIQSYPFESSFFDPSINENLFVFSYDNAGQLSNVVANPTINQETFIYSYDPAGNISEKIVTTNTYNTSGTPISTTTTTNFAYNALNELTSVVIDGIEAVAPIYQWDAEGRLVSVISGNQTTNLTYDGLGRCVQIRKLVDGSEVSNRQFIWNDNDICEERLPSGTVTKRFFQQGVQILQGNNIGIFFYTRDHLGSIREVTDSSVNILGRYAYDPFGLQTPVLNPPGVPPFPEGDFNADFGFAGMFWASEVNIYLTRYRAYDPTIGRWLSRDPLENAELRQGINLFAYVQNDPVNRVDPLGLQTSPNPPKPPGTPSSCDQGYGNCVASCLSNSGAMGAIGAIASLSDCKYPNFYVSALCMALKISAPVSMILGCLIQCIPPLPPLPPFFDFPPVGTPWGT